MLSLSIIIWSFLFVSLLGLGLGLDFIELASASASKLWPRPWRRSQDFSILTSLIVSIWSMNSGKTGLRLTY